MSQSNPRGFTRLPPVLYVAFTFGLVLLGFGVRGASQDFYFVHSAARAQGVILSVFEKQHADSIRGFVYVPKFIFSMPDGKQFTLVSQFGRSPTPYFAGEKVTILYDPAHPVGAKIDNFGEIWTYDGILLAVGIFYAGITSFACFRIARSLPAS